MWILVIDSPDFSTRVHLKAGSYCFGRPCPGTSITVPKSITFVSRKSLVFQVDPFPSPSALGNTDIYQKLTCQKHERCSPGVSIGGTDLNKGETKTLQNGSEIVIGGDKRLNLKILWQPFLLCSTHIYGKDKQELQSACLELGFHLRGSWDPRFSTHLISIAEVKPTMKVVMALACMKPVVQLGWLRAIAGRSSIMQKMPDQGQFCCTIRNIPQQQLTSTPRSKLFENCIFGSVGGKEEILLPIKCAGGLVVDLQGLSLEAAKKQLLHSGREDQVLINPKEVPPVLSVLFSSPESFAVVEVNDVARSILYGQKSWVAGSAPLPVSLSLGVGTMESLAPTDLAQSEGPYLSRGVVNDIDVTQASIVTPEVKRPKDSLEGPMESVVMTPARKSPAVAKSRAVPGTRELQADKVATPAVAKSRAVPGTRELQADKVATPAVAKSRAVPGTRELQADKVATPAVAKSRAVPGTRELQADKVATRAALLPFDDDLLDDPIEESSGTRQRKKRRAENSVENPRGSKQRRIEEPIAAPEEEEEEGEKMGAESPPEAALPPRERFLAMEKRGVEELDQNTWFDFEKGKAVDVPDFVPQEVQEVESSQQIRCGQKEFIKDAVPIHTSGYVSDLDVFRSNRSEDIEEEDGKAERKLLSAAMKQEHTPLRRRGKRATATQPPPKTRLKIKR